MLNLISALFTYLFILLELIVVIFIVIYVLNKIYVCIFDNKPFPPPPQPMPAFDQPTSELNMSKAKSKKHNRKKMSPRYVSNGSSFVGVSSLKAKTSNKIRQKLNSHSNGRKTRSSPIYRGSKSSVNQYSNAMRITLTLKPCYLISIELDINNRHPGQHASSFMDNCKRLVHKYTSGHIADVKKSAKRVLKYYDDLSTVPKLNLLLRSTDQSEKVQHDLNNVTHDATEKRYNKFKLAKRNIPSEI